MKCKLALIAVILTNLLSASVQAAAGDTLDRSDLTASFGDEFDHFSWFIEDAEGKKGCGIWRTSFSNSWSKPDAIPNRTIPSNKEEQIYVDRNFRGEGSTPLGLHPFSVKDGKLIITADRAPNNPALYGYKYTSGMISTKWHFTQQYGLFEMRAKLPKGKGFWPAFWLMPKDGTWPPEIDIMEVLGHETTKLYTTLHYKANGKQGKSDIPAHIVPDMSADFHTYAVDWGPQEIIFYFDDKEVARRPTPADMHKPFYLMTNLAVGGTWPGSPDATTPFPAQMEIDWIRVWQRPGYQSAN